MTVMVAVFILSGCSTSKEELLPPGEQSMLEIWQGKGSGGHSRHMTAARDTLRRPLTRRRVGRRLTGMPGEAYAYFRKY